MSQPAIMVSLDNNDRPSGSVLALFDNPAATYSHKSNFMNTLQRITLLYKTFRTFAYSSPDLKYLL
jgi:hypothetical protein